MTLIRTIHWSGRDKYSNRIRWYKKGANKWIQMNEFRILQGAQKDRKLGINLFLKVTYSNNLLNMS